MIWIKEMKHTNSNSIMKGTTCTIPNKIMLQSHKISQGKTKNIIWMVGR